MKRAVPILVLLNLALVVAVIFVLRTRPIEPPSQQDAMPAKVARSMPAETPNRFNWRQLESEDYRVYIANLRAIGCPEETVRDIIVADVNKLFAVRRKELMDGTVKKWWQPSEPLASSISAAKKEQLRALDKEKRDLVFQLLGIDLDLEMAKYAILPKDDSGRLDFLPPEKSASIKALLEKYYLLEQSLLSPGDDPSLPPDWKKLRELYQQRQADLAALLSPQELEEYQLRNHEAAEILRRDLVGFHPGPDEFRAMFRLLKEHEEKFAYIDPNDEALMQQRASELKQVQQQFKDLLGENRYAEYERSRNPQFQNLYRLAQQYNLPEETATAIFERNKEAQARWREIESAPQLSEEEKARSLRQLQDDLQSTARTALGESAYRYYTRWGVEHWLGN